MFYSLDVKKAETPENENLNKSIIANVKVVDSESNEPIKSKVAILFGAGVSYPPPAVQWYDTDSNGTARIEYTLNDGFLPEQFEYYKIYAVRDNYQRPYAENDPRFGYWQSGLSMEMETNFEFAFDPYYSFKLSAKNMDCFSPEDTAWIKSTYQYYGDKGFEAYGCADTNYSRDPLGDVFSYNLENITFDIRKRRDGELTTTTKTYSLSKDFTTEIHISY